MKVDKKARAVDASVRKSLTTRFASGLRKLLKKSNTNVFGSRSKSSYTTQ